MRFCLRSQFDLNTPRQAIWIASIRFAMTDFWILRFAQNDKKEWIASANLAIRLAMTEILPTP